MHGHFRVVACPHAVVAASRNTPPIHWADSSGEVTKRSKVRDGIILWMCPTVPNQKYVDSGGGGIKEASLENSSNYQN